MSPERFRIRDEKLKIGDQFHCEAQVLKPDSFGETPTVGGTIEDIRGGGFYGRVLLFSDEVIKSAEPDPWHLLWRRLNWRLQPFPPQSSELAAQLDYLAGSIIHRVIPTTTSGRIIAPEPIGYVDLGPLGYGQALERMRGRGARFLHGLDENLKFAETRKQLWEIGKALGIEHTAQVHKNNPFGKQNIWITDDGRMIWLDTLPAIPHTGMVLPFFYFPFHRDIRKGMGKEEVTFNQINTSRMREYLTKNDNLFTSSTREELDFYLTTYDRTLEAYAQEANEQWGASSNKRRTIIEDSLNRNLISQEQAKRLYESNLSYGRFIIGLVTKPGIDAFLELIQNRRIYRVVFDKEFQGDIVKFLNDSNFRRQRIIENTTLQGMREAYLLGLVSDEEWQEAWELLEEPLISGGEAKKLAATYVSLQTWYAASSALMNILSASVGVSVLFSERPLARLALAGFIEFVLPSIVRVSSTALVETLTNQDIKTAIKVSGVPFFGHLAVVADLAHRYGDRSEKIWHYTKRNIIASLSKMLRPWGGWNSDLEAELWEKLRAEKW